MWWNEERTAVGVRLSTGGFLSWTFRGYETYVLVVALGPILDSLISPVDGSWLPFYAGIALGVTLLGWAVGGALGGLSRQIIGRRNTATYSVLGYAVLMVLTALSQSFLVFVGLRFLTGVLLGTEGERGTMLFSGLHPDDRHARGSGSVYAGFGVGVVLASVAWFALQSFTPEFLSGFLGTEPWRYLFVIGVLPAIFVLYLRRTAAPTGRELDEARTDFEAGRETGESTEELDSESIGLAGLFGRRSLRRRVAVGVGLVFAATATWWGVTAWIPLYATTIATDAGFANPGQWGAVAGVCYGIGGVAGYVTVEPIADRIGRLGSLLVMFLGSFAVVQAVFLLIRTPYVLMVAVALVGYFTLGGFGWLHVYLAELFPRAARGTALATVFSLGRLVGFVVPVFAGYEIATFDALTSVVASVGALYAVGIFAALYLPDGMERPFAERDSS